MKLKTLKDFKITYDNGTSFFELDGWRTNSGEHFVNKLKQEAIKWVKNCKAPVDFTRNDRCGHNNKEFCCCCQRTMKMNNITEEDLK